jgi:hypothetical protein
MIDGENYNLKIQLAQELEKSAKFQRHNQELYDYLIATIFWLMRYAKEHNINPPNKDRLWESINQIHSLMDKTEGVMFLPTESQQRNKTTGEPTESKNITIDTVF